MSRHDVLTKPSISYVPGHQTRDLSAMCRQDLSFVAALHVVVWQQKVYLTRMSWSGRCPWNGHPVARAKKTSPRQADKAMNSEPFQRFVKHS